MSRFALLVCVLMVVGLGATAWAVDVDAGPVRNQLRKPGRASSWVIGVNGSAAAELKQDGEGIIRVTVSKPSAEAWHVQFFQNQLNLVEGASYTLSFEAKADAPRTYACAVGTDVADWHDVSPQFQVPVTTQFQKFEFQFTAKNVVEGQSRGPQFYIGTTAGTIYLKDVALVGPSVAAKKGQTPAGYFEFAMDANDTALGNALDMSFLNSRPADHRIIARAGHFVDEQTGERVRFFGTNLVGGQAFPEKEAAIALVQRLGKAGINLVRLHAIDNSWGMAAGGSVFDGAKKGHVFSAENMDRLDYLIAQLKEHGIYVNMNLKACKVLTSDDGFADSVAKIPFDFQKRVDFFDRRMIDLQKQYIVQLLGHKNAYTGMTYGDDPVIMVVEGNNENSLVNLWDPSLGTRLDELPEPFKGELAAMWSAWLKARYGTDEKLKEAWNKGVTPAGPSMLTSSMEWTPEQHEQAKMDLSTSPSKADAAPSFMADLQNADGTEWHLQNYMHGLTLKEGELYTVSFRAKADKPRKMPVLLNKDEEDWGNFGLQVTADVGTEWKDFAYTFKATNTTPEHGRLGFAFGRDGGKVWVEDLQLAPGAKMAGLCSGESLAKANLALPMVMTPAQRLDWLAFLVQTEKAYADELRKCVKDDAKSKSLLAVTQIEYGGITGLVRENDSDYIDAHAYWQHPEFPVTPWDPQNWRIGNSPEVAVLEDRELARLALNRIATKPYTVSEYDHPAPSDYVSEMMPTYATFAALQDWDAIYTFACDDHSGDAQTGRIAGYFDQMSHPAKWCMYPSAALIFRKGLIPSARQQAELFLPATPWSLYEFTEKAWRAAAGEAGLNLLSRRVAVSAQLTSGRTRPEIMLSPEGGPSNVRLEKLNTGNVYIAAASQAVAFVGFIGGQTMSAGDVQLKTRPFGNRFGAVMAVATDGKPLATSKRILVTICGRVENQGMAWDVERKSVGTKWGYGPTIAEYVPAEVMLPGGAAKAYALDSSGKRTKEVAITTSGGNQVLAPKPEDASIIFEVVRE